MKALSLSENLDFYVTSTDVKNYIYCPRVVYFKRVMGLEPMLGAQQMRSLERHSRVEALDRRRVGAVFYSKELRRAEKLFDVAVTSHRLKASSRIDCVVKVRGRLIPVEYKFTRSRRGEAYPDHKYQLAFHALLLEELSGKPVILGYIYYVDEGLVIRVKITEEMKRYVKKLIKAIRSMVHNERLPRVKTNPRKCTGGCGYGYLCQRV